MSPSAPIPSANEISDELLSSASIARLEQLADELNQTYASNHPFPHIVMDDFLPASVAERLSVAFAKPAGEAWVSYESANERKKLSFPTVDKLTGDLRQFFYFMNSATMMRFLEKLTGIKGMLPDPYYYGGGLHQIEPGGHLEVHVDFNMLPQLNLYRRLNLLIYLNKDWKEEYGGHLELWNADMTRCERKILPIFNRCVVFSTIENSYHGHPHPLTCPEGMARRSLALYYYTAPEIDRTKAEWKSTQFQTRPEPVPAWKSVVKQLLPPIVLTAYRRLRGR